MTARLSTRAKVRSIMRTTKTTFGDFGVPLSVTAPRGAAGAGAAGRDGVRRSLADQLEMGSSP
jgi:hypothetical protein